MDSEILDQLTNLGRDVDSEFPKPKRGRKKKADTKMNELEDNDVRDKRERLVACVLSGNSKISKKKFCHDQQRWGETILRFYGGDTAVMRGDIELMGPPSPPTRENPGAGQTLFGIFFASITICQVITSQVNFAVIARRQASSITFYAILREAML